MSTTLGKRKIISGLQFVLKTCMENRDTGYTGVNGPCPVFKEIGKRCGPFELSFIPIWRGGTLSFVSQLGLRVRLHPLSIAIPVLTHYDAHS